MPKAIRSLVDAFRGLLPRRASPAEAGVAIVALLASDEDRSLLSRLADEHQWTVHQARTAGEAQGLLGQPNAGIILCDRELLGAEWREGFRKMTSLPQPVYAILISNVADEYLRNEVTRRGGQDLLPTPLREADVLRAVRLAWSYWSSSMKATR